MPTSLARWMLLLPLSCSASTTTAPVDSGADVATRVPKVHRATAVHNARALEAFRALGFRATLIELQRDLSAGDV